MFFQLILDSSSGGTVPASSSGIPTPLVMVMVGAIFLVILFVAIGKLRSGSSEGNWDTFNKEKMRKSWKEIQTLADQSPITRKLAVMEADKLVDHALKTVGFPGETMADRMKVAEYKHPKIREMWGAHKLRNQLAHEAHFTVSERQTRDALRAFEAVLLSLKAL